MMEHCSQVVQGPAPAELPATLPAILVDGLYVHIPFCFHKCHYCDFYSITRQTPERMDHFVDLLLQEAAFWKADGSRPTPDPITIFFGGGTPTLLPHGSMRRLIGGLHQVFNLGRVQEWTVEVNPATANLPYCRMLRTSGVDRLSFGAQSFRPSELAVLERHHEPDDVTRSISIAREAGFERLNLDLIYAIPGQDLSSWRDTLEQALAFETRHLSCYGLTFEPNTPIAVKKRLEQLKPAPESLELEILHWTRQRLSEAGMPPYEISNYAKAGQECRHNLLYWSGGNYIGLGPSAASHIEGHRWRNRPHLRQWEESIEAGVLPAIEYEILSPARRHGEWAMLALRLTSGLNFAAFADRTGHDARRLFADQIERLAPHGLIEVTETALRLTPRGLEVADSVASEFLSASE